MAPKKREAKEEEVVRLGPQVADGELVFGIVNSKKLSNIFSVIKNIFCLIKQCCMAIF